ncbi:MAG TPA: tyrosine-type recombinase/integrase [Spirochaetia bacterium]|nr:tyrosine-type recombinase/integrase [Spirochaetia bacterium]
MTGQERLFHELGEIHDAYRSDVKQFIEFMTERKLLLVDALNEYSVWLDQEHSGKHYSPATINRKIAAARNRIRYAFKHSSAADDLKQRYQLEDALRAVRPKQIDYSSTPGGTVLSIDEVRTIVRETNDTTIKLMIMFLVGTGTRISEMLAVSLSDLKPLDAEFAEIRVIGKGGKERVVHARTRLVDRARGHFQGSTYLFEHHGRPFSRISVTNRIKYESLKTIGREVTASQLRHTWAVTQIQRGKDVRAVALALGQSDSEPPIRLHAERKMPPKEAFLDLQDPDNDHT